MRPSVIGRTISVEDEQVPVHAQRSTMNVLVINASAREDGNSHLLALAAIEGARAAGNEVNDVHLSQFVERMLGNCRTCRRPDDNNCALDDRYETLLFDHILPADAIVIATPLYFYGMPGRLKTMFDRMFCYTATSSPHSVHVVENLINKKVGVLISCEEAYVGATSGLISQFQELTRYLHHDLVGVVVGNANSRGEIKQNPSDPISAARTLGSRLFQTRVTDYRLDTVRSNSVWDA